MRRSSGRQRGSQRQRWYKALPANRPHSPIAYTVAPARARAPCAITTSTTPAPSANQKAYAWITPRSRALSSSSTSRSTVSRTPRRLPRGAVRDDRRPDDLGGDGRGMLATRRCLDGRARGAAGGRDGGQEAACRREAGADQEREPEPVVEGDEPVRGGVVGHRIRDRGEDRQAERATDLLAGVDQAGGQAGVLLRRPRDRADRDRHEREPEADGGEHRRE